MINEKLKKAEDLGKQGMVDEAQKVMEEAEALKKTDLELRVCGICGASLSVYDSDRRLADHFGGNLHFGYMQIREKIADLEIIIMSLWIGILGLRDFIDTTWSLPTGVGGAGFCKKRERSDTNLIGMMIKDQKNVAGTVTGDMIDTRCVADDEFGMDIVFLR
ncbi:hypothetical protein Tsubulata_028343 [Turnera subulata]|uniref:Uncharacterized protein n=1 Tax=Turnera subulata TaxID=218843 RepID=A0A9Q0GL91_9ROSI|nr:hypothetical protein Tsubulata_028343 [Turnera subulata]